MSVVPKIRIGLLEVMVYFVFVQRVNGNLRLLNVCSSRSLLASLLMSWVDVKGIFSPHFQTEGGTLTSSIMTKMGHVFSMGCYVVPLFICNLYPFLVVEGRKHSVLQIIL